MLLLVVKQKKVKYVDVVHRLIASNDLSARCNECRPFTGIDVLENIKNGSAKYVSKTIY